MISRILAAFSFFTRLPLWRLADIPSAAYSRVVELWPFVGWLTGGLTAVLLLAFLCVFPPVVAVILAYVGRLLLTGALHEDGLADFIDGMGGGRTRERVLEIMKDSHIGSYGVIGLICYYLLLISGVASLPVNLIHFLVFAADPWGKFCAELTVGHLPYASNAEQAKNKTVYRRIGPLILACGAVGGFLPTLLIPPVYWLAAILPLLTALGLILWMRKRIGGYTGDCCGAAFLCCELAFILSATLINHISEAVYL